MAVVKTMRLVRWYEWNVKTIIYVTIHDKAVSEAVIVGPVDYFTRRVLVITSRNMSEEEADRLVAKVLNSDRRCHICHHYGSYTKVPLVGGRPDFSKAVCDQCDPSIRYTMLGIEAFDKVFVETRGN